MDDSLFSALRIVALALGADGNIDPKAATWFFTLLEVYGLAPAQKEILHTDLRGHEDIDEIYSRIHRPRDKDRLLTWLHSSMQLESSLHPAAKKIYNHIQELNRATVTESPISYSTLASALIEEDRHTELWKELEQAGQFFSQRMTIGRIVYPLRGTNSDNPIIIWVIVGLILIVAMIEIAIKSAWFH